MLFLFMERRVKSCKNSCKNKNKVRHLNNPIGCFGVDKTFASVSAYNRRAATRALMEMAPKLTAFMPAPEYGGMYGVGLTYGTPVPVAPPVGTGTGAVPVGAGGAGLPVWYGAGIGEPLG